MIKIFNKNTWKHLIFYLLEKGCLGTNELIISFFFFEKLNLSLFIYFVFIYFSCFPCKTILHAKGEIER